MKAIFINAYRKSVDYGEGSNWFFNIYNFSMCFYFDVQN